jgi:AcrR family transcriptional regulator
MSPRKPAARDQNLRQHLIASAARLIAEHGGSGLAVRDIARQARVADGVLYNYFEDKDDLLAQALLAHVGSVMAARAAAPLAGTSTVAENLRLFIEGGVATLSQVAPAFAGLVSQPGVLARFHAMVGGDAAFGSDMPGDDQPGDGSEGGRDPGPSGPRGFPEILRGYLAAEQRIGRIDQAADVEAAVTLIVGTIHGEVLPRVMFNPGSQVTVSPDMARRVTQTILAGIAPR